MLRLGQTASQKPHSMQWVARSSIGGADLNVLQVDAVVAGQDHVRREDAVRVGELLDPPHHVRGLLAPLVADERRHVDAGAVLGLERAVVLVDDQRDQIGHERRVPVPVARVGEPGGQREVQVAVGRVPGGVRQEAVLGQQFLQVLGPLGDAVRREAHVLDDQGGTVGALLSDDAEESVADPPGQLDLFRVAGEFHRVDQVRARSQRGGLGFRGVQAGRAVRAELDQQRRGGGIQTAPVLRGAGEGLRGRGQRRSEHELHRFGTEGDQAGDQRGRFADRRQHDPADRRHGRRRQGVDHGLGHERERSLGSDDEPPEDLQRGIGVQQGRQRVAVGVADGELVAYPLRELVVGQQLFAQPKQPGGQLRLGGGERLLGVWSGRVDDRPRGEHQGQRRHGVVGVALQGAAHAAGVVGDDPADRGHVGGGGIGPQAPPDAPQDGIGLTQDRSGAGPQPGSAVLDHHAAPVPPDVNEDVVGLRLPVHARAPGAERGVPPGTGAVRQDRAHVVDRASEDDDLRQVPVGAGIGGVADQVGDPVQHLLPAHQLDQVVLQGRRGTLDAGRIDGIVGGRARGPADGAHVRREHLSHVTLTVSAAGRPGIVSGTRNRTDCSCPAHDEYGAAAFYGQRR